MAQLQITSQNARKYTVIMLLLLTGIAAVLAVVIGLQLDRQLAGDDADAAGGGSVILCSTITTLSSCTGNGGTLSYSCEIGTNTNITSCVINCAASATTNPTTTQISIIRTTCASNLVCSPDIQGCRLPTPSCTSSPECGGTAGDKGCATGANTGFRMNCVTVQTGCVQVRYVADASCTGGTNTTTTQTQTSQPSQTSSSTASANTCSGGERDNGCTCSRDDQCNSGFCDPSSKTCKRPESCQGTNRPNGCQCGTDNDSVCASGNCQINAGVYRCRPVAGCDGTTGRATGCNCGANSQCASNLCDVNTRTCLRVAGTGGSTGNGGSLPSTGLFDEDGRPMLIGLLLLGVGFITFISTKRKNNILISNNSDEITDYDIDPDIARIINSQKRKK